MTDRNVAVPQGDVYPNGVPMVVPDVATQGTTHVPGSFFQKSLGFPSIRIGRHRLHKGYRSGIHFVPQRYAEDVGSVDQPLMVDPSEVGDVADLPGSERLDDEGRATSQNDRVLIADEETVSVAPKSIAQRHRQTKDLSGLRNVDDEFRRWGTGLLRNPVEFLSSEYKRTPLKAVAMAGVITALVYVVSKDFERSLNRRKRKATVVSTVAATPAAVVETVGTSAAKAVEVPAKVVKETAEVISEGAEAVAEGLEETTAAVAEAAS